MEGAICKVKFEPYSPAEAESVKKIKLDPNSQAEAGAGSDRVGRQVDNSQADDRRLIGHVRDRPLLYARNNMPVASYHTHVKRLWKEVADKMGWTVEDVRRKWSHIRASYSRHLRNEINGAITRRGRTISKWYLADELNFLREHMATDTRSSSAAVAVGNHAYAPSFLELDMSDSQPESEPDVKPFLYPAPPAVDDSCSSAFDPEETSSYFQFFRGLHSEYQELSARKQRKFKRQCLMFLHQLLDEEDRRHEGAILENPINLTSSHTSDEDESKPCLISAVSSMSDGSAVMPD